MKRFAMPFLLCFLLISSAMPSAFPQKAVERFDPNGTFWMIGDTPNDFLDFSAINLNSRRLRRLPASGLQLNDGRNFRFRQLTVRRDKFTFTTVQIRNVSYSFSGRFLKGGVFAETMLDDDSPVLEGVLTKFVKGQKVAEAKLRFEYFGGT